MKGRPSEVYSLPRQRNRAARAPTVSNGAGYPYVKTRLGGGLLLSNGCLDCGLEPAQDPLAPGLIRVEELGMTPSVSEPTDRSDPKPHRSGASILRSTETRGESAAAGLLLTEDSRRPFGFLFEQRPCLSSFCSPTPAPAVVHSRRGRRPRYGKEQIMRKSGLPTGLAVALLASTSLANAETLTIATVNNADMIIMRRLSPKWEQATGHKLNWVVLEENVLRQRVTTDVATKGGQFDILTIGSYEAPIWGKGWLNPVNDLGDDYDYADMITSVKNGLSQDGKLFAVPFYAESSFTFYRKDLFDQAGLKMPDKPTYDQIAEYAAKLTDKSKEQYGFCQRGKPDGARTWPSSARW